MLMYYSHDYCRVHCWSPSCFISLLISVVDCTGWSATMDICCLYFPGPVASDCKICIVAYIRQVKYTIMLMDYSHDYCLVHCWSPSCFKVFLIPVVDCAGWSDTMDTCCVNVCTSQDLWPAIFTGWAPRCPAAGS